MNVPHLIYVADKDTQAAARGVSRLFEVVAQAPDAEERFKRLVFACNNWSDHPQQWVPPIPRFIRHCHERISTRDGGSLLVFSYLANVDRWGQALVVSFILGRDEETGKICCLDATELVNLSAVPETCLMSPREGWYKKLAPLVCRVPSYQHQ